MDSKKVSQDYLKVEAIFNQHCLDCHSADDPEGNLVMESFEGLMKGGESGPSILKGKSQESLLVQMIEGKIEKEGKKLIMPPGKRKKLTPEEINVIKSWIDQGAPPPPDGKTVAKELVVPKIALKGAARRPIYAFAFSGASKLLAVGRYGEVELRSAGNQAVRRILSGAQGNVNALVFSADGSHLFAGEGEPGLFGEVRQWKTADGSIVRTFEGHRDAIYSLALSPDGKILATGSYDQKIKLWNTETGEELRTLSGHNGAVFDLSFRSDGRILASASADRTIKLWNVSTGERKDTLSQSLKELYTVAFSPDGKKLYAAGVDNRIRIWEISDNASETTNPLLESKFAHEGAILNLTFSSDGKSVLTSADDRTVKLWDADPLQEKKVFEKQPDWPPALAFLSENKTIAVGRLDGSLAVYDVASGNIVTPPKPELAGLEPRVARKGTETRIKLVGKNLEGASGLKSGNDKIKAEILEEPPAKNDELWVKLSLAGDLKRGVYEVSIDHPNGESGKMKFFADDLPQVREAATNQISATLESMPATFSGILDPMGDVDEVRFQAKAGQTIVFEAGGKNVGSKANTVVTLFDANDREIARSSFETGSDPVLAYQIVRDGEYRARISDLTIAGSKDHFYYVSIGDFPYVTGAFPFSVSTNQEAEVSLIGYNLPAGKKVKIKAEKPGEVDLPLEGESLRSRGQLKVLVSEGSEVLEQEPNNDMKQATVLRPPAAVSGRIMASPGQSDVDYFVFEAKAGQEWMIETMAAQRGLPIDPKIEVLHEDGKPVQRLVLQAVRNSAITFRPIDSTTIECRVDNWEEMELNQFLYFQGEVVKLFRAPQGPDSGFHFYGLGGKRRTYFDTSATAHALDEPCYIVEPHPPGAKLVQNGLPSFPIYFSNDDDAYRKSGSDARLHFTAPTDGKYFVRLTDTRGYAGERLAYRLSVREPKPDFKITLSGANPAMGPGSGQSFSVSAERTDDFEGEIKIEITGLPPGFVVSTPLVIEAGHVKAEGTINALPTAPPLAETNATMTRITATAMINGKEVKHPVKNFEKIKLGDKPKLFVILEPFNLPSPENSGTNSEPTVSTNGFKPYEITIAPGQTIPARLKIKRNGHEELVTFTVENLPHGVIVDNIGLNGVLIPKDENERQIFLTAAKWVPDTDRLCFAIEKEAGKQTSLPFLLKVRAKKAGQSAGAKVP